jgi:guanylate kinase
VGKSTLAGRVLASFDNLEKSVSFTTRSPRSGEVEGENYFFIEREDFKKRMEKGEFIEYAEVYGNLYGTSINYVEKRLSEGRNVVLEIDVQGGLTLKEKRPDAVLIMVLPPSLEQLENRLRGRKTDDEGTIVKRLDNVKREIECSDRYDYIVVNGEIDRCVEDICTIIKSEAMRRERINLRKDVDYKW